MPYHSEAIGVNWNELDPGYQGLFLGFLRGLGAGTLTVGLAVSFMAVMMLRNRVHPYLILLPIVSIIYLALLCFAAYTVYSKTPGNPPLVPQFIMLGLAGVATLLLWIGWRAGNNSTESR